MTFELDPAFIFGLILSMTRVTGFVIASPIYSRALPAVGRMAMVVVLGLFFAVPISPAGGLGQLLVWIVVNLVVGAFLGFATGLVFTVFTMAGSLMDVTSGLSVAQVLDPLTHNRAAPFGRSLNAIALALFFAIGGHRLVIRGLDLSFSTLGVTGSLDFGNSSTLGEALMVLFTRTLIAAIELAMPALAALFLAELVLGLASRFAPQANVFLLGLPLKLLAAFASVTVVMLLVPDTMSGVLDTMRQTFEGVMGGVSGG